MASMPWSRARRCEPTRTVPNLSQEQWEKAVLDYLTARQTFRKVVEDGPSDIGMILRIFVYIDPGVGFKFNHTYVARADATMIEPRTGRAVSNYAGLGKAVGPVSRGSKERRRRPDQQVCPGRAQRRLFKARNRYSAHAALGHFRP